MKLKKLPIGISTLKEIIEEDYLYVDKTKIAQKLIEDSKYYFLSRPRRFGKSLFLDTLRTIFDGDKEIFKGLYIYDNGYKFEKHPIIHISFAEGSTRTKDEFLDKWQELLQYNEERLGIDCYSDIYDRKCFSRLIREAQKKYKKRVVILIDEYDKPILDNIENPQIAEIIRDELKNFYSVIKGADEYLKFVFITGVSKFSKVSLFSGLNNIQDITLNPNFATICGYTQRDVEIVFEKHLIGVDMQKVKKWYNGYKFLGEGVYNPFDILLFIANNFAYRNYWFSTATPTFLLKLIEKNNYFLPNLENIIKDDRMLDSFDVNYIELETLMWQTGYLTIYDTYESIKGIKYKLTIPNQEVKISLMGSIADFITKIGNTELTQEDIYDALINLDFKSFEKTFQSLFASIPYNNFTGTKLYEYEGYYASVFYAYLKALGLDIVGEDVTNKGRIDLTLKMPNSIIIIEFKVDGTDALKQIKEKNYSQKYINKNLPIFLVGVEFDTKDRNISQVAWEKI